MLYEVKVFDKNGKLKKVISEKQVQKKADAKFKEEGTSLRGRQRYKNALNPGKKKK